MAGGTFHGRLFGPGLPGTGVFGHGRWVGGCTLQVTINGATSFRATRPAIDAAGFNAEGLRISWQKDAGAYSFIIDVAAEQQHCLAMAPPELARVLHAAVGVRTRLDRRFRLGGLLLALFLALPLLGIGLFLAHSERVADWAVARITPAQEAKLGELVLAQTRLQMRLVDQGPAVAAISAIGSKLTIGSPHRYRWLVAERPDINAFAAPGGVVVVFSGLLRSATTAEELAGVLAHEIAHAELRHSLRALVKSLGLRALVNLLAGDISASVFADLTTRLTELRFSRDAEREADRDGLRRLVAARIDPQGMIRFYERVVADQRVTPPALLSTHPATGERLASLRQEVARLPGPWPPLGIDIGPAQNPLFK